MAKGTPTKIFKIRRCSDGLFSCGGMSPRFDVKGKAWTTLSGLKNHLNIAMRWLPAGSLDLYKNCEVITIELTPKVVDTTSVSELLLANNKKAEEKKRRQEEQEEESRKNRELAELARLQQKYGVK